MTARIDERAAVSDGTDVPAENQLDASGEERLYRAMRRFWHPVMYAAELPEARPSRALLLDEQLVLARLGGEIRCFPDLCVHRGTALSLGWIEDDQLRCAYHGWTYAADGRCTSIPSRPGAAIPGRARLRSYDVAERYGLVWVCLEPPAVYPIPAFPESEDDSFRVVTVPHYDWKASATRRVENFVDFAHFAWVHDGVLGSRDNPEVPEHSAWREGPELRFAITVPEPAHTDKTSTLEIDSSDPTVPGERDYRLTLPFTVWLKQTLPGGNVFVLFMTCSPLERKRCRSFTHNARSFGWEEDDSKFIEFQQEIAEADRTISESQRPEELPIDLSAELHVRNADRVSIEYRRWLVEIMKQYG